MSPAEIVDFLGAKIPGAYFIDLRTNDPLKVVASLKVPIFIAQGERDYQVTTADFENWKTALKGKPNATFKLYPALNHQFLEGKGPSTPAEYANPGHAPVELINDLSAWISK
ncbi:MAG: dienelactone hydrolase family protein [Archangium sp.]